MILTLAKVNVMTEMPNDARIMPMTDDYWKLATNSRHYERVTMIVM